MGWSIGFDNKWQRDIGYGVPATCDHPKCNTEIDRGLSYVCGNQPHGGDRGCGLYFCQKHLVYSARLPQLCARCKHSLEPFKAKPDCKKWLDFKLTDPSWSQWRRQNQSKVAAMMKPAA